MYSLYFFFFAILLAVIVLVLLKTSIAGRLQALRAPLLFAAAVAAVPLLAISGSSLARGLFWVGRAGALGLSTLAFFAGWQCLFLERLIRAYGPQRIPGYAVGTASSPRLWEYLVCGIPSVATIAGIYWVSWLGACGDTSALILANWLTHSGDSSDTKLWLAAGVAGGFLFAALLALIAVSVQLWSSNPGAPVLWVTPRFGFLVWLLNQNPPPLLKKVADAISGMVKKLFLLADPSGRGYTTPGAPVPAAAPLQDGHVGAVALLLLSFALSAIYFAGYHGKWWIRLEPGEVPAAIYLYLTLITLGWILAGVCFLLDGFRVPTLTVLAIWAWIVTFNPLNQHYFDLKDDSGKFKPAPPAAVGDAHQIGDERRWIVISADGGGIQAAAWSTQVLGALTEELGAPFGKAITMMSGVSGGSAGLMFFNTLYDKTGFHADKISVENVISASREAELSDVAFGMTYYDLARPFVPFFLFGKNDRGVLLERAWQRHLKHLGKDPDVTLGALREGVVDGKRPVLIFNSTVADSGQAFVLSNAFFPPPEENFVGTQTFDDLYGGKDVSLVTAVRMSATFPFVSPAARASQQDRPFVNQRIAFADGGYYDNYGVVNALAWLRTASKSSGKTLPRVMWIQIRSSKGSRGKPKFTALASSAVGPILTLYDTRGAAQQSRANQLDQMTLLAGGKLKMDIRIPEPFVFPSDDVPLSWVLTNNDKKRIGREWDRLRRERECTVEQLRTFIEGKPLGDPCPRDLQYFGLAPDDVR